MDMDVVKALRSPAVRTLLSSFLILFGCRTCSNNNYEHTAEYHFVVKMIIV